MCPLCIQISRAARWTKPRIKLIVKQVPTFDKVEGKGSQAEGQHSHSCLLLQLILSYLSTILPDVAGVIFPWQNDFFKIFLLDLINYVLSILIGSFYWSVFSF